LFVHFPLPLIARTLLTNVGHFKIVMKNM
jgi:hypothetical protein